MSNPYRTAAERGPGARWGSWWSRLSVRVGRATGAIPDPAERRALCAVRALQRDVRRLGEHIRDRQLALDERALRRAS